MRYEVETSVMSCLALLSRWITCLTVGTLSLSSYDFIHNLCDVL